MSIEPELAVLIGLQASGGVGQVQLRRSHADILREALDGRTGSFPMHEKQINEEARAAHYAKLEQAARAASRRSRAGGAD